MEEYEEKWKEETDRGEADSHLIMPPMLRVDLVYGVYFCQQSVLQ